VDLDIVLKAVEAASHAADAGDAALRAAGAMPVDATDFDRGIAAGMALARYIERVTRTQDAA
jgi:hypothetical protein